jgi:gamma-glutamylcyclotransferase (GGCT)/AIG2-like uncharacterized protein YtfP
MSEDSGARAEASGASRLFVYGTLLDPSCRERLLGHPVRTRPARLDGYRVAHGRHYYLVASHADRIDGLILLDLSAADLAILDRYEEVPQLYTRETVETIVPSGEKLRCWVYMPTSALLDG